VSAPALDLAAPVPSFPGMPRTVLVTGISGNLGRALAKLLHTEAHVVGVDRRPFEGKPKDIDHHQVDLRKARVEEAFREKPAVHRFPGAMAARVHDLAATVATEYGGRADRIWTEAADGDELRARIESLPGFGEMKVKSLGAVLAKRYGVAVAEPLAPPHPTLGDVDSPESLQAYQAAKREHKAKMRAAKASR